jgi:hypothetical protein
MATTTVDMNTAKKALAVLDEMIERQRKQVRDVALRVHPGLREADLRDLQRFPDVAGDVAFQLESSRLESLLAARMTLKARLVGTTLAPTG